MFILLLRLFFMSVKSFHAERLVYHVHYSFIFTFYCVLTFSVSSRIQMIFKQGYFTHYWYLNRYYYPNSEWTGDSDNDEVCLTPKISRTSASHSAAFFWYTQITPFMEGVCPMLLQVTFREHPFIFKSRHLSYSILYEYYKEKKNRTDRKPVSDDMRTLFEKPSEMAWIKSDKKGGSNKNRPSMRKSPAACRQRLSLLDLPHPHFLSLSLSQLECFHFIIRCGKYLWSLPLVSATAFDLFSRLYRSMNFALCGRFLLR